MRMDLDKADEAGYIILASKLRLKDLEPEEESDYQKGLLFDPVSEILTRGHLTTHTTTPHRVDRLTGKGNGG